MQRTQALEQLKEFRDYTIADDIRQWIRQIEERPADAARYAPEFWPRFSATMKKLMYASSFITIALLIIAGLVKSPADIEAMLRHGFSGVVIVSMWYALHTILTRATKKNREDARRKSQARIESNPAYVRAKRMLLAIAEFERQREQFLMFSEVREMGLARQSDELYERTADRLNRFLGSLNRMSRMMSYSSLERLYELYENRQNAKLDGSDAEGREAMRLIMAEGKKGSELPLLEFEDLERILEDEDIFREIEADSLENRIAALKQPPEENKD
ncbi:MAG: hypothetical protein WCJ29_01350 [bacterium]